MSIFVSNKGVDRHAYLCNSYLLNFKLLVNMEIVTKNILRVYQRNKCCCFFVVVFSFFFSFFFFLFCFCSVLFSFGLI